MCLYIDRAKTREIVESGRTTMRCWKVLLHSDSVLYSINYFDFIWRPGMMVSNLRPTAGNPLRRHGKRLHGIHVYLTRNAAIRSAYREWQKVVPVTCHIDEFIAAGGWFKGRKWHGTEAIFRQVHLSPGAHRKATKADATN